MLQNAKPIARINAAIVLARLGETGDEAVVKPLLKILNAMESSLLVGPEGEFVPTFEANVDERKARSEVMA